jgi:Protein of unknown function (DUF2510)
MAAEPRQQGGAGWYPDPEQVATVRYWDGDGWTEQRAPVAAQVDQPSDFTFRLVLGIAGAIAVAVSIFLPMLDSGTSLHIADNSVIAQSKIAGIIALVVALAAGARAAEARHENGVDWSLIILGALVVAGAVFGGTGKRTELVTTGSLIGGQSFQGSPGIGIYVLGAGGLLIAIAGLISVERRIEPSMPLMESMTEEAVAAPRGRHPLDPDNYDNADRPYGWYVVPESPWTMREWTVDGWSGKTQKTPKETLDGWWHVRI